MSATVLKFTEQLCLAHDLNRGHPPADGVERASRADIVEYIDAHSVDQSPDHPTTAIAWDLQRTLGESDGRRMLLYASRRWDATPLRARDVVKMWWDDNHEPEAWRDEYLLDVIGSWRSERDRLQLCADAEKAWLAFNGAATDQQLGAWYEKFGAWYIAPEMRLGKVTRIPNNVVQFPSNRAAVQAVEDEQERQEMAEWQAERDAEFAVYDRWIAAGEPAGDALAEDHRLRKRRILQYQIDAEYDEILKWEQEQQERNEIDDDVAPDDPRFSAYLEKSNAIDADCKNKMAAWEARYGGINAIRRIFIDDKRIPPGSSIQAMDKLRILFALPPEVTRYIPIDDGSPINLGAIPAEYRDVVKSLSSPLIWAAPGAPMPANLHVVPAAQLPDILTSSASFIGGFVPPEYAIDGIAQRRYFYSMTAQTGVGKTSIAMRWMAHIVTGRPIGDREVQEGNVLYMAGENPDDVRARWLALSRDMGIDPDTPKITWLVGITDLGAPDKRLWNEIVKKGLQFALVIVDTAAAYNPGDDENSNNQAGAYARQLRSLTQLPGGPCVVALTHPTKRAGDDDLMPRGGGAFLAEVDGNMAVMRKDSLLAVVPFGKFRGDMSWSQKFEIEVVGDHPKLKDARGRQMRSVLARPVTEATAAALEKGAERDEDCVLRALPSHQDGGLTQTDVARKLRWFIKGDPNQPAHYRVKRLLEVLQQSKLAECVRKTRWRLTSKGEIEVNRLDLAMTQAATVPLPPVYPTPPTQPI